MHPMLAPFQFRYLPLTLAILGVLAFAAAALVFPASATGLWIGALVLGLVAAVGLRDLTQPRHAILRNYPLSARLRFLLERVRPEIRQYFLESDTDGAPFSRDMRAIVYQRAKRDLDKRPFGTQADVYGDQYEWLHHSLAPKPLPANDQMRVTVGRARRSPIRPAC